MTYAIRYTIETGAFEKDDVTDRQGLTQQLVLLSCIEQPNGSYTQVNLSNNGKDGPINPRNIWKAWLMLGAELAETQNLDEFRREFCRLTVNAAFEALSAPPEKLHIN